MLDIYIYIYGLSYVSDLHAREAGGGVGKKGTRDRAARPLREATSNFRIRLIS